MTEEEAKKKDREANREKILARRKRFIASSLVAATAATAASVGLVGLACACLKYAVPRDAADDETSKSNANPSGPGDAGVKGPSDTGSVKGPSDTGGSG